MILELSFFLTSKLAHVMENTIRSLDDSFKYFDALYKNTVENCILLMDEEGITLSVNKAFENCFGYKQKEVVGKHLSIFFTEEDVKKGKPHSEVKNVLARGQSSDNNYLVRKDKSITGFQVNLYWLKMKRETLEF